MFRTPFVVVAALAVALGAVGLVHAGGSAKPLPAGWAPGGRASDPQSQVKADTTCGPNSVLLFSARGSGDKYGADFGHNRIGQWTQFAGHVLGHRGWSVRDLQAIYPAPPVPFAKLAAAVVAGSPAGAALVLKDYRDAVSSSWRSVKEELVAAHRRCPSRPILLAGYSQGGILLRYVIPSLERAILRKIVSVDLFADPTEQGAVDSGLQHPANLDGLLTTDGIDTWAGSAVHAGTGFRQRSYPGQLHSRVFQYCITNDFVCNLTLSNVGDPENVAVEGKTHASYAFGHVGVVAAERVGYYGQTIINFKTGRIGPLRLNRSRAAAIIAFAGKPDVRGTGDFDAPSAPGFHSLGYGCAAKVTRRTYSGRYYAGDADHHQHFCKTIYYLNGNTGLLGGLWTSSHGFRTAAGSYPGLGQDETNRLEGVPAYAGCGNGIRQYSAVANLFMENEGGTITPPSTVLSNGKVYSIAVESRQHQLGLTFC